LKNLMVKREKKERREEGKAVNWWWSIGKRENKKEENPSDRRNGSASDSMGKRGKKEVFVLSPDAGQEATEGKKKGGMVRETLIP